MSSASAIEANPAPAQPDLSAVIAAPGLEHTRRTAGAVERGESVSRLAAALEESGNRHNAKVTALARRAGGALDAGDSLKGAKLALKAVEADPEHPMGNYVMGVALYRLGHLSRAIAFLERVIARRPGHVDAFEVLGHIAWKLNMLEGAEKFFRIVCDLEPSRAGGPVNLAGVLRDQGRYEDAVEILRINIMANQGDAVLWNGLGAVLLEKGEPSESLVFFDEALRLSPRFGACWHNLGYARTLIGDLPGAAAANEHAVEVMVPGKDRIEAMHGLALCQLAMGQMPDAWSSYEIRFDKDYDGATRFVIDRPRWDGDLDALRGKRLMIIGEQGLGDEVLFLNAAADLMDQVGPGGEVIIIVEQRLVPLVSRSFPKARVGHHMTMSKEGADFRKVADDALVADADLWIPIGSALAAVRPTPDAFPSRPSFLSPDPARVDAIAAQLDALPPGLRVGLCWKSKNMSARRRKFMSPFEHWRTLMELPGVTLVTMQYGDTAEEIARAREEFGVTIHEIEGLDLMNDLEGVAAAGAALDVFLGPPNASTNLAAAAGGRSWMVSGPSYWVRHGREDHPYYPSARLYETPGFGEWAKAIAQMTADVAALRDERAIA